MIILATAKQGNEIAKYWSREYEGISHGLYTNTCLSVDVWRKSTNSHPCQPNSPLCIPLIPVLPCTHVVISDHHHPINQHQLHPKAAHPLHLNFQQHQLVHHLQRTHQKTPNHPIDLFREVVLYVDHHHHPNNKDKAHFLSWLAKILFNSPLTMTQHPHLLHQLLLW